MTTGRAATTGSPLCRPSSTTSSRSGSTACPARRATASCVAVAAPSCARSITATSAPSWRPGHAARASADPRAGAVGRSGLVRDRAHALRAQPRPRPAPLPCGVQARPAGRPGHPPLPVDQAEPDRRPVPGARLGDHRAADRGRPRVRDPAPADVPLRPPQRVRDARRRARGDHAGGPRPGRAPGLRPVGGPRARACAVRPRGGHRSRRPAGRRSRARLGAAAADPRHRAVDDREARPRRPGPRRHAAGGGPRLRQARRPAARPAPPRDGRRGARPVRAVRAIRRHSRAPTPWPRAA